MFYDLRREVIVRFVEIGVTIVNHCSNFLFLKTKI